MTDCSFPAYRRLAISGELDARVAALKARLASCDLCPAAAGSTATFVNIMAQYRPCYRSGDFPEIARRPTHEEIIRAVHYGERAGLTRISC